MAPLAVWAAAKDPAGLPRWAWAAAIVLAAWIVGRIGGRLAAAVLRWALLAVGVAVAWQVLHGGL